mmetsp:Transcript_119061/g.237419  ORF Transcript_119061/g.237419 Transcript_119061/m.237419 type:complete len:214 (-) Transcript_119061:585-1226(-)
MKCHMVRLAKCRRPGHRLQGIRSTVILREETPFVVTANFQHLLEALINIYVLSPATITLALLFEELAALGLMDGPSIDSTSRKNLYWPMHAKLAVVEVHAIDVLWVVRQQSTESRGKEDSIGVNLHCPLMGIVPSLLNNCLPNLPEDVKVQSCAKLATKITRQAGVDKVSLDPGSNCYALVTENGVLLTSKNACAALVLHCQQTLLIAVWDSQ